MTEIRITGKFENRGDLWWSLCKEYPIITPGRTQEEALARTTQAVKSYIRVADRERSRETQKEERGVPRSESAFSSYELTGVA